MGKRILTKTEREYHGRKRRSGTEKDSEGNRARSKGNWKNAEGIGAICGSVPRCRQIFEVFGQGGANGARSFITKGMFLTVMSVMIGIGMVPAMVLVPIARKKFSLKQIYIASMLFGVVASVILYFIGYDKLGVASIFVLLFFLILIGIPLGVFNCITYNFVADCTDYAEWKNGGQRIEGVSFAAQTLISKASAGVATLITSVMLTIIKYQEPLEIDGILVEQAQSASTRDGLFLMVTLIPAAGMLLTCIPILFFDYTGKKKEKIRAELEVMRAERMAKLTGEGEAVVEKEATAETSDVEG